MGHTVRVTHGYVAAIDQGTTSTRCLVFDRAGEIVGAAHREHRQSFPRPGWVEHDASEIWHQTQVVVGGALDSAGISGPIRAVGITNQRETTLVGTQRPVNP